MSDKVTKITTRTAQKRVKLRTFGDFYMQELKDQINNFRHISEDGYWPSWKQGEEKRQQIMELLQQFPNPSIEQIAKHTGISTSQARRHRAYLIAAGVWKICGCGIALGTSFLAAAYCADSEVLDEWIECHIKFPALELQEEIVWKWEQRFL